MVIHKNIAVSESGFVFNPMTGDSFSTNPVGRDILQWLRDEKTKDEIVRLLTKKYRIEKATAEKDLYDFMLMLKGFQIVQDDEKA